MKVLIYAVLDVKAQVHRPFFFDNKVAAMRAFTEAANSPEGEIGRYPEEFQLLELGELDGESGKIVVHPKPVLVGSAAQFKRSA